MSVVKPALFVFCAGALVACYTSLDRSERDRASTGSGGVADSGFGGDAYGGMGSGSGPGDGGGGEGSGSDGGPPPDAPHDAGMSDALGDAPPSDAPPDALVCTMPPDPINLGPNLNIKVDLKSGDFDSIANAFVSYELGFELKASNKTGANACESSFSGSATGHFKITVAGQIVGAAIKGGVTESICKTPTCINPPKETCAGDTCDSIDGNIGVNLIRGVELDLCKKFPWVCKFGSAKAVATVGAGVVGNGNKQAGKPTGSCTNCCDNGGSKWSAGIGPQVGAKGKLSFRIDLWKKLWLELAGSMTGCVTGTANLGANCDGNPTAELHGNGHFSMCLESAAGLGQNTTVKFVGPKIEICVPLGWWEVCTSIPKCFVDVGDKALACPGGL